ncbi:hypothetical protein SPRG_13281 [Saprolegnia parasitica CBS 223.65]|uniref:Uncharacterized protein n=1 Tax=Saprolegnia parasitica (strain CBS 223.65) TaxID=695850 RepID=A0A067C4X4_SAPPC|nr:hypothetical protein SPRG_13281 [Saprolegnia parasitica CBS 223.65]KDO21596.1 hypothetical protein SPRG_13281 [Saprolegnia parasitica CBS 223.65]|eukprot:XP_012207686.1 hypothetical protein SPRG_13281 [Saprolegnia parasitica CBS 223.65]
MECLLDHDVVDTAWADGNALYEAATKTTRQHADIVKRLLSLPVVDAETYLGRLRGDGSTPTLLHYVARSPYAQGVIDCLLDRYHAEIDVRREEIAQWALPLPPLPPVPADDDDADANVTGAVSTTTTRRPHEAEATVTPTDEVLKLETTGVHTSLVDTIDGYHGRACTCRNRLTAFAPQLRLRAALFSWMEHWRRGAAVTTVLKAWQMWATTPTVMPSSFSTPAHVKLRLFVLHWRDARVVWAFYAWKHKHRGPT